MPFEIAPREISIADKLAALIEAGRASHPEMRHKFGGWGDGVRSGCAMTFAGLALGIKPREIGVPTIADAMGIDTDDLREIAYRVIDANDGMKPISEIVEALRTNTLPASKLPVINLGAYAALMAQEGKYITWSFYGYPVKFDGKTLKPKKAKPVKAPAKKCRQSAKTGATWPVARGCYA